MERYADRFARYAAAVASSANPAERPMKYLSWIASSVLLGEATDAAREHLPVARARAELTKNPRKDLEDWASIAACALLLGESGHREIELGLARVEAALSDYGGDPRVLEPAVGLALVAGQEENAKRWRDLRVQEALQDGSESVGFELLYLSSDLADDDELADLALGASEVIADIAEAPLFRTPASLVLSLAAVARKRQQESVATLLAGLAHELDSLVFGEAGTRTRLSWSQPSANWTELGDGAVRCELELVVSGSGRVSPGAHRFSPVTERLAVTLNRLRQAASDKPGVDDRWERCLLRESGQLEVAFRFDGPVELSTSAQRALVNRVHIAGQHLRSVNPELRPTISASVQRR